MPKQCNACGGRYAATQADGARSFHACAPVSRFVVRQADGTRATVDAGDVGDRAVLDVVTVERPNKRDENFERGGAGAGPRLKAAGAGAIDVRP